MVAWPRPALLLLVIVVASLAVRGVPEDSEDDSKLEPPELLEAEEMPSWEYVGAAAGGSSFFLYRLDDDHIHLVMLHTTGTIVHLSISTCRSIYTYEVVARNGFNWFRVLDIALFSFSLANSPFPSEMAAASLRFDVYSRRSMTSPHVASSYL